MAVDDMALLWSSSHINGGSAPYVESMYEQYLADPNSVSDSWRSYFDKLPRFQESSSSDIPHSAVQDHFLSLAQRKVRAISSAQAEQSTEYERKQVGVIELIEAYRQRGHQMSNIDPLGLRPERVVADLQAASHGLTAADMDTVFQTGNLNIGTSQSSLKDIISALETTYCGNIGAEFMHIVDTDERTWIQNRIEAVRGKPDYSVETKQHLLERLTAAEGMEKYLGSRYPGTKRFGLEGGESLIPMVDEIIQRAGSYNAKEIVIGMAHRGRLNLLVNILGKNPSDLFDEFEGRAVYQGSADVKYHQGFSSNVSTPGGEVHLALAFNPSHLEIVAPVVEGSVRARQDRRNDEAREQVIPLVMHGDAAFAGQGVVMETFQMSQTRGFGTGGTLHLVINNQVGFTTSKPEDARSTEYCTDVAKMIDAPIFHVNGDDPEAVLFVSQLALDYRQEFKRDVVIDLVCYRRRGHNEADEPSGTQPLMYQKIKKLTTTRTLYADRLVAEGVITDSENQKLVDDYRSALESGQHVAKSLVLEPHTELFENWEPYIGKDWDAPSDTSYDPIRLRELAEKQLDIPDGFKLQPQVRKIVEDRGKMAAGAIPSNWGFAETLAYATLLDEGFDIRFIGQDAGRGTFSHRHAALHNQADGECFVPLQNLSEDQPLFTIHDSFLSEEAVLAYEYGYSTTRARTLNIWEAQFGDFANGAQVVIDQFITCGEHKWGRLSGLVMLLPHGYEGQGPEHSSARLERYMQLCAEHNIQVCIPTTPAQVYHMLRRQMVREMRRPLVVMTPKSLLRHKAAISNMDELANGKFETVLDDTTEAKTDVTRVVLCSGKVYYELAARRDELELNHIAIVRIEQQYPFPYDDFRSIITQYSGVKEIVWCQEEPRNQGVWYSTQHRIRRVLMEMGVDITFAGREPSASPAAGYAALHARQQEQLIKDALAI